jgi:hypothetical protein
MTAAKTTAMAEAFITIQETMATIAAACAGYRAQLEAAGFSPTAAEMMAMKYHDVLIASAFSSVKK